MKVDDFNYYLPDSLIAQRPADKRDRSRLLVVHRNTGRINHRHFYDILDYLKRGDCLVLNDSKVLPARLYGTRKGTGAKIEVLLIKRKYGDIWETMVRPGRRVRPGDVIEFKKDENILEAKVLDYGENGTRIIIFLYDGIFMEKLEKLGRMPLPPYIKRPCDEEDKSRYQTVYCNQEGSVAAPTAGLHFTEELLKKVQEKGVEVCCVTLHVGIGTFRPVKAEHIEDHHMHFEGYNINPVTAEKINRAKVEGRRVIAVGTTSARTVESAAVYNEISAKYEVKKGSADTDIFIYPGYDFKIVDSLITNFHLPKSTLMMLTSAFYDREKILEVYKEAVKERYRFFSYGDAMFLE